MSHIRIWLIVTEVCKNTCYKSIMKDHMKDFLQFYIYNKHIKFNMNSYLTITLGETYINNSPHRCDRRKHGAGVFARTHHDVKCGWRQCDGDHPHASYQFLCVSHGAPGASLQWVHNDNIPATITQLLSHKQYYQKTMGWLVIKQL